MSDKKITIHVFKDSVFIECKSKSHPISKFDTIKINTTKEVFSELYKFKAQADKQNTAEVIIVDKNNYQQYFNNKIKAS